MNTINNNTKQNFAQDFTFHSIDDIEIQDGKLIIKGNTKGTPTNFYYDLATGKLSMNSIIGENKQAFSLYNDTIRSHIANLPSFEMLVDKGRQVIHNNRGEFQRLKTVDIEKKGEVANTIATNILDRNSIDPPFLLKMNVDNLMSKNQTLEHLIKTFELNFINTSISATEQPENYHLFSLLQQSINGNNAYQLQECWKMLAELTNIHQKLQNLGNHQHSTTEHVKYSSIYI
jgi:hypothetical protein